jgi:hypothetical protein
MSLSRLRNIFFPRKKRSSACMLSLNDTSHIHTDACFVDIAPLSIVELWQSQGCKSCPPAIPTVHKAVLMNPNLLLLTYDVTYWDHSSGWKDTFGQNRWDQRQRTYVKKWGRDGLFTPQVVVDGVTDGVGSEMDEVLRKAMEARSQSAPSLISVDVVGTEGAKEVRVTSTQAEAEVHDVLLVMYDAREQIVKVGKGPNKGKKVAHRNIVGNVMTIGHWQGGEAAMPLPEVSRDMDGVLLVQGAAGGPIVTALKL